MRIGQFNLNWPWKLLKGVQEPGAYEVPLSVQPTLDIGGNAWPPIMQTSSQTQALILGNNTIALPRGPDIGRARLWSYLTVSLDIVTAALTVNVQFRDTRSGIAVNLFSVLTGTYFANIPIPMIGSGIGNQVAQVSYQSAKPVYVPGQFQLLEIRITAAAGTETAIVNGVFTEADENFPLIHSLP